MPYLLRKIRKARWDPELAKQIGGLLSSECPGDCLADLNTANCSLSFWEVQDSRSNLEDVITALSSNCDRITNIDYALISRDKIEAVAGLKKTTGQSPHTIANSNWHWDLMGLSAARVTQVAEIMYRESRRVRVTWKEVEKLVRRALETRQLDRGRLKIKFE
jgi:hypothetical protein